MVGHNLISFTLRFYDWGAFVPSLVIGRPCRLHVRSIPQFVILSGNRFRLQMHGIRHGLISIDKLHFPASLSSQQFEFVGNKKTRQRETILCWRQEKWARRSRPCGPESSETVGRITHGASIVHSDSSD
jgi:hypothetical protein